MKGLVGCQTDEIDSGKVKAYRQHGVVGVEEDVGDDRPGLLQAQIFFIKENAHELGDGESGVSLQDPVRKVYWEGKNLGVRH